MYVYFRNNLRTSNSGMSTFHYLSITWQDLLVWVTNGEKGLLVDHDELNGQKRYHLATTIHKSQIAMKFVHRLVTVWFVCIGLLIVYLVSQQQDMSDNVAAVIRQQQADVHNPVQITVEREPSMSPKPLKQLQPPGKIQWCGKFNISVSCWAIHNFTRRIIDMKVHTNYLWPRLTSQKIHVISIHFCNLSMWMDADCGHDVQHPYCHIYRYNCLLIKKNCQV
jgi:hypothetical protein